MIPLIQMSRIGKSTETESRLVVVRGWEKGGGKGSDCLTDKWSSLGMMQMFYTVGILNIIELFTLKWLIMLCEFHLNKRFFNSSKVLIGIASNVYINLKRIGMLTILNLPIHEHDKSLKSLIFFISVFSFAYSYSIYFARFICKYVIFLVPL